MAARGRPAKIDKDVLVDTIIKYKDQIIQENEKVVSKHNEIWISIARDLENHITPVSLYTLVSCNRYKIREKLSNQPPVSSPQQDHDMVEISNASVTSRIDVQRSHDESTLNESEVLYNDGVLTFTITMPKDEFTSMIMTKTYRRNEKGRPPSTRQYMVLQPGTWQQVFTEKIWECSKLPCGFNFKRCKLINDGKSGYVCGSCKCGSIIKCVIDNKEEIITKIKCKFIEGEGSRCGKRYLRNPLREAVVEKLQGTTVMKYRTEMADKLMQSDDNIEPPHLFSSNVLRTAKYEIKQKDYFHKDPIRALEIMQLGPLRNIIHNIGLNPFFVHYWSNYQLDVYRTYTKDETASVYIDATGSIIKKIKRPDHSKTGHIFLYNCVVNSEKSGLFPVAQMISEKHNTNIIQYWLMEWVRFGAPRPREVVCDFSRALLTAAVRSFTNYSTLDEYANACTENILPNCYIRIDVAHFIKKYANFLKDLRPRIKQFYLYMIGQFILCRNVETAEEILKGILIIAQSETEGVTKENNKTVCEEYKIKMKELLANECLEEIVAENTKNYNEKETEDENTFNKWNIWANDINNDVKNLLADNEGDRENAHYMPQLAEYVMKDVKLLPLWSCVCRDKFGFGRIPASSASVESDFNIIKNNMLKTEKTPMRADEFVTKHVNFMSGRLKLVHANKKDIVLESEVQEVQDNETNKDIYHEINIPQNKKPERCPACENGHEPTGGHICYICKKYVHALEECSIPVGEEGYGQKRICVSCQNVNNIEDIIATGEVEDWRGLATADTQSKGKYLQKGSIQNEFLLDSNICKIPIIKNGNSISLKPVHLEKCKYSLANTCAFDSILQLFIAAYFDSENIKKLICTKKDLRFFELINEVVSFGIKKSSYRLRAIILRNLFENKILPNNSVLICCEVTIGFLCRKLFLTSPSFKERTKCSKGCTGRTTILPIVQVKLTSLLECNFKEIEKDITIEGSRPCCQPGCDGLENTTISYIGQFIIIEIYSNTDGKDFEDFPVPLENIPKKLKFSFMMEEYNLTGLIDFKPPLKHTRSSSSEEIGHYTAISYRHNKWIKYDDCKDTETIVNTNYIAYPHIIVYVAQ